MDSDTTKIRNTAIEVVQHQERVCQERYASDRDVTKMQMQIAVHWWLHGLSVGAVLALAWKILSGGVTP